MKHIFSLKTTRSLYRIVLRLGSIFFDMDAFDQMPDVRLFEYAFVIEKLSLLSPGKVLDIGCTSRNNFLTVALAATGWEVYGIDNRPFLLKYPGFHFIHGDVMHMSFSDHFFDVVCAVSTLEHLGLSGRYKIKTNSIDNDFKAMPEIKRVLKHDGSLIITVPYGQSRIIEGWARIYDQDRLQRLFSGWTTVNKRYFIRDSSGNGHLVSGDLCIEADFEKNDATVLLGVCPTNKL